jgi:hypothetical protein
VNGDTRMERNLQVSNEKKGDERDNTAEVVRGVSQHPVEGHSADLFLNCSGS